MSRLSLRLSSGCCTDPEQRSPLHMQTWKRAYKIFACFSRASDCRLLPSCAARCFHREPSIRRYMFHILYLLVWQPIVECDQLPTACLEAILANTHMPIGDHDDRRKVLDRMGHCFEVDSYGHSSGNAVQSGNSRRFEEKRDRLRHSTVAIGSSCRILLWPL